MRVPLRESSYERETHLLRLRELKLVDGVWGLTWLGASLVDFLERGGYGEGEPEQTV